MRVTNVTASRSKKVNLGNYESADAFASFTLALDDGDSWEKAQANAFAMARMSVAVQEYFIRGDAKPEPPQSLIDAVIAAQLKVTNGDEIMPIRNVANAKHSADWKTFLKLHKGSPKGTSGNRFPGGKDLKHFRVTTYEGFDAVRDEFLALYGDEPREFRAMFLSDDIDEVFSMWQEVWNRSNDLVHRCDGYEIVYPRIQRGQPCQFRESGKKKPVAKGENYKGCSEVGRLLVWAYEVRSHGIGQIMAETHAQNDLYKVRRQIKSIQDKFGRLTNIPLIVKREPRDVNMQVGGVQEKWLISVEVDPAYDAYEDSMAQHDKPAAALPNVDPDTGEIYDDEEAALAPWWGDAPPPAMKKSRPWAPEDTRAALRCKAYLRDVATDAKPRPSADEIASALDNRLTAGSQHALMLQAFDCKHASELTDGQAQALCGWLSSENTLSEEIHEIVAEWWLLKHPTKCAVTPNSDRTPRDVALSFAFGGRSPDDANALPYDDDEVPF